MKSLTKLSDNHLKLSLLISNAKRELESIKRESGTRKRYLAEQELFITETLKMAEDAINNAHDEYSRLERLIASLRLQEISLKEDIATLVLDKNTLETEVLYIESGIK